MRQSSDNMNRNLSNNNNNFPLDINTLLCCRFYNEDDYFTNQINESKSEKIISKVDELNCQLNDKKDLFQKDDNLNCLKLFSADRTETVKDKEIMRGEIKNKKHIFVCNREGCEKKYKSKENLNLHIKNKHDMIKPYFCRFCLSRFSHRNGKTYHERKFHINYLPYTCTYENCSLSFASKSAMKSHSRSKHCTQKIIE